jgi:cytochrome c oxidase subunit III
VRQRIDLSGLKTYAFGSRMPMWWGTLGFITLEGTAFALALGTYFYLMTVNQQWPISAKPPGLLPGTLVTLFLLASAIPNHLLKNWARSEDLRKVRVGLIIMSIFGVLPLFVRAFEFTQLNVSWDANAYGSILWFLLGLHTTHLLTDLGDTAVLATLMFTRHGRGRRFSDVEDNAVYWDFVILSWLPIYVVLYWVPRW